MEQAPEPTLTHKNLAKALGVTVTTVKSYRRKFPEFWKVASQGKPIRFPAESLELCRSIRRHFKLGLSVEETRQRLAMEFEAVTPPSTAGENGDAGGPARDDTLARMEALMDGLFSLQNRTHSLLAELVSKLDTLADRLGQDRPAPTPESPSLPSSGVSASRQATRTAYGSGAASRPSAPRVQAEPLARGGGGSTGAAILGAAGNEARTSPPGVTAAGQGESGRPGPSAPSGSPLAAGGPDAAPGIQEGRSGSSGESLAGRDSSGSRPHVEMLDMPVTVRTPEGEYLGVTAPGGRRFTLADLEAYLLGRKPGEAGSEPAWSLSGETWTLGVRELDAQALYHFHKETTPRGNTVVRLAAASSGGEDVSSSGLQALLKQVKDSLA